MAFRKIGTTIKAGDLRHRLEFMELQTTITSGITKRDWVTICTCWGNAETLAGREYWEAAAINHENSIRFTIRYNRNIKPTMRIRFQQRLYDISTVTDVDAMHIKLEIQAVSVVDG